MNDFSFFPTGRSRTTGLSAVRVRHREKMKDKKPKLKRKHQRLVNQAAQEKVREAIELVETAQSRAKNSVPLFLMLTKSARISRRHRGLIVATTELLKKRGWKVLRRMRNVSVCHNEEESDCEPEFDGRKYATYLFISGFA